MGCPQIMVNQVGFVMLFRIGQNAVKVKENPMAVSLLLYVYRSQKG